MSGDPLMVNQLLARALDDIRSARHVEALAILDKLVDIAPNDSRALFLRGAEHAELGHFDKAVTDLRGATELNSHLWTAHFELGLLFYMNGNYRMAEDAWAALTALPPSNPLRLFVSGLILFTQNKQAEAIQYIEQGIRTDSENTALSENMLKILSLLNAPTSVTPTPEGNSKGAQVDTRHVLLNNYDELSDKKKS